MAKIALHSEQLNSIILLLIKLNFALNKLALKKCQLVNSALLEEIALSIALINNPNDYLFIFFTRYEFLLRKRTRHYFRINLMQMAHKSKFSF